jgi:hypothetical protein
MILYNWWIKLGYSKWKEGKNFSYFLYRLWLWFGVKTRYIKRYNIERDESLVRAKESLQMAFTPQLKKMLKDKLKED